MLKLHNVRIEPLNVGKKSKGITKYEKKVNEPPNMRKNCHMWCWNCTMWGSNHQVWEKSKETIQCDKRIVTCDIGTAQCEEGTVKCEKKSKRTT